MYLTAAPGNEDSRIRRKEFPSVVPATFSGSTTNLPNLASSLISIVSILGFQFLSFTKSSLIRRLNFKLFRSVTCNNNNQ